MYPMLKIFVMRYRHITLEILYTFDIAESVLFAEYGILCLPDQMEQFILLMFVGLFGRLPDHQKSLDEHMTDSVYDHNFCNRYKITRNSIGRFRIFLYDFLINFFIVVLYIPK